MRSEFEDHLGAEAERVHARYQYKLAAALVVLMIVYFVMAAALRVHAIFVPGDVPAWVRAVLAAVVIAEVIRWFVLDGSWLRSTLRTEAEREHLTPDQREEAFGADIAEAALHENRQLRARVRLTSFNWLLPRVISVVCLTVLAVGYSSVHGPLRGVGATVIVGLVLLVVSELHDRVRAKGTYSNAFAYARGPRNSPEI